MNKIVVTMDDIKRYKVIPEVIEKRLTLKDASELLFLSYRHAIRLKQKVKDSGLEGILPKARLERKIPASASNRQTTKQVVDKILKHREELYYDFNIMHFKDKLSEGSCGEEVHNIYLSYESLRQILIKTGKHEPKKKKIIHRQRRSMTRREDAESRDACTAGLITTQPA